MDYRPLLSPSVLCIRHPWRIGRWHFLRPLAPHPMRLLFALNYSLMVIDGGFEPALSLKMLCSCRSSITTTDSG